MPLEMVSRHFALKTRYLFEFAQAHNHWLIVPTLLPNGCYQVALMNPDGEWHYHEQTVYRSAEGAIEVGRKAIDCWMAELEAEG